LDLQPNGPKQHEKVLVVAGGDGTISAVAGVLAGTGTPLGILPLGTLNHFAKDLGLPLEVDAAAGIIASGKSREVDVAELNGSVFVNNSSVGLYPFMVERRNAHQHRLGVGKLLATLPALFETLGGASWHRLDIAAAGERQRIRTPCVFVGNNSYEVDLKALASRTRLDRGELDIHIVRQQSRLGVLLLPIKIALGIVNPQRDVETFQSTDLEIVSRRRRSLSVSLDGEVVRMETPLRYRSRPGALRVFCGPKLVPPT
jgi:diacylglycerol kinase family enzyme